MKLNAYEVARVTEGELRKVKPDVIFTGVAVDSRLVSQGDLFVALPGERTHGKNFVGEAIEKGALAVLLDDEEGVDIPRIVVKDAGDALMKMAKYVRKRLETVTVIAITGSVGKTTTKEMIRQVLQGKYRVYCNPKSYNSRIGVSISLINAPEDTEVIVQEIGAQKPGEVLPLARLTQPQIAVLTKIARAHLEFFKDIGGIAREKGSLFEVLPEDGFAVLNSGSPALRTVEEFIPKRVRRITYGLDGGDFSAEKIEVYRKGSTFWVRGIRFDLQVPGIGFVEDALAAVAVGSVMGIGLFDSSRGLREFSPPPGRMDRKRVGDIEIIDDSYNANPDSMELLLKTVTETDGEGRVVFVIGDMLELGFYSREIHREMGHIFAKSGHKELVTVGELAREMGKSAKREGVKNVFSFRDWREASEFLKGYLREGDRLVLKGSRAMELDRIIEALGEIYEKTVK